MQLYVELRGFNESRLDMANLRYLTTNVEVNQLQAILHLLLFQEIEGFEQLAGCQTELAGIASTLLPLATARGSQLDADTDIGT